MTSRLLKKQKFQRGDLVLFSRPKTRTNYASYREESYKELNCYLVYEGGSVDGEEVYLEGKGVFRARIYKHQTKMGSWLAALGEPIKELPGPHSCYFTKDGDFKYLGCLCTPYDKIKSPKHLWSMVKQYSLILKEDL